MTKDLVDIFLEHPGSYDEEEKTFSLLNGYFMDEEGKLTVMTFVSDVTPDQIMELANAQIGKLTTVEAIWSLDRYSKPGQGIETGSLLTVYHWSRAHGANYGFRLGVVPYEDDGTRHPIQWDHQFWGPIQVREVEIMADQGAAAVRQVVERLKAHGVSQESILQKMIELTRSHMGREPTQPEIEAYERVITEHYDLGTTH